MNPGFIVTSFMNLAGSLHLKKTLKTMGYFISINQNFMQPMGRLNMHSWTIQFFLFFKGGKGRTRIILCFSLVLKMFPNVFPRCSQ
jgi:hypothetical protein